MSKKILTCGRTKNGLVLNKSGKSLSIYCSISFFRVNNDIFLVSGQNSLTN